jgi:tetratricopeptide (TPR) repeat protein
MENTTLLQKISLIVGLSILVFSLVLVLPFTDNFIFHTKAYLMFFGALAIAALFVGRSVYRRSVEFILSPLTGSLILFGLATLASTFFTNPYPVEALLGFGGIYLGAVVIALLGGMVFPKNSSNYFITSLAIAAAVVTLGSVSQLLGYGPANVLNQLLGLDLPTTLLFNLSGSALIALMASLVSLVGIVSHIQTTKKVSQLYVALLPILVISLAVHGWALLPGKPAELSLPSWTASWSVALDAIRSPRSALIGVGPEAYSSTYTQFKPLWLNNTDQWAVQFPQASNLPLSILTTMGFFGLFAWLLLALRSTQYLAQSSPESKPLAMMVLTTLALQLILPPNAVLITIQALAIAFWIANEQHKLPILQAQALNFKVLNRAPVFRPGVSQHQSVIDTPLYIGAGLSLVAILAVSYLYGRAYAAHVLMYQSEMAAGRDEVVEMYDKQQRAVQLNPYLDQHRRRFATTNLLIAIAISNKADVTEADQAQVSELLQQSISEARSATILDPVDSQNWTVLAQIYQNMIPISEEAVQWTIQSYVAAIETNPTDPLLRLSLGGIFMDLEQYEQAANVFVQTVSLKEDLAASHYNLARAYNSLKMYAEARTSYQQVLRLLESDTDDYVTVTGELEEVEAILAEMQPEEGLDEAEGGAQAGTPSGIAPSIIGQNLDSRAADLVSNPSGRELQFESESEDLN